MAIPAVQEVMDLTVQVQDPQAAGEVWTAAAVAEETKIRTYHLGLLPEVRAA
ncbi:MAG: hypothetical protein V6Z86_05795 [Hyphomicrobiales bacterium]